jgi:hypothetical protein
LHQPAATNTATAAHNSVRLDRPYAEPVRSSSQCDHGIPRPREARAATPRSTLGHEFERPWVEVVEDLLQPRDPLVKARRPPPMPDRIHAPPRSEADEPAGVVGIPQQLRAGSQTLQTAPVGKLLPATHELVLETRLHAPHRMRIDLTHDRHLHEHGTGWRRQRRSRPKLAFKTLSTLKKPEATTHISTRTRSIAANQITFVKSAASLPCRSHLYGFWLRGGLGSDIRARVSSLTHAS